MHDRRFAKRMIALWQAMRQLLLHEEIEVSGRIKIETVDRKRIVTVCGVSPICQQWKKPTMLMDATLPALPILQAYYRQLKEESIMVHKAAMPSQVHIRQLLVAPVTKAKLIEPKRDTNRKAMGRYSDAIWRPGAARRW
jgi:hypothetical protein